MEIDHRSLLLHSSCAHHSDLVREIRSLGEIMRDEEHRHRKLAAHVLEDLVKLRARDGVECAERLIEQDHPGPRSECARERDALALPARELVRIALAERVRL